MPAVASEVPPVVTCEGAPRDLGLDQGRACAALLASRFRRLPSWTRARLHLGVAGGRVDAVRRELRRHFPHQAESLAGLAVGARVPEAWLTAQMLESLAGAAPPDRAGSAAPPLALGRAGPSSLLACGLAGSGGWVVRRSRPEGLFASLEVTRPWLTSALAGVNSEGLALVVVPGPAARGSVGAPGSVAGAPAALLAQDCLERFAGLEAALEWCLGRPAGGSATVLLADARGELAGVERAGGTGRVLRPTHECLAAAGAGSLAAEAQKSLAELAPRTPQALLSLLSGPAVALEPAARRLHLADASYQL